MVSLFVRCSAPVAVTFVALGFAPLATRAQSSALPPARTYYLDQYGQPTKLVKERWRDNANGQKQGVYLLYNAKGLPITRLTYANGVKSGPAFLVQEDYFYSISFRLTRRFSGSFVNNKEEGWWEVYNVGTSGEPGSLDRRMQYVAGNLVSAVTFQEGKMTASYSYQSGNKNGLTRLYGPSPTQYATGQYAAGERVGTWRDAGIEFRGPDATLVYRKGGSVRFERGNLVAITDPDGTTRTLAAVEQQRASAATAARAQQAARQAAEHNFYTYDPAAQRLFQLSQYNLPAGGTATGKELLARHVMQSADCARLIAVNTGNGATLALLLKQLKALHVEPMQALMRDGSLPRAAFTAILEQYNAQLDAEMLYYGLRGVEAEKGHGSSLYVQTLLSARRNEAQSYKQLVEWYFNQTAAAAHDAYSDTQAYPLRRWIYEEYSRFDPDPLKWMNMLTASDAQSDQKNFPKLFGN